ncbi:MAG TPA: WcaF family extracellular polysaccharide biosynthesis acetyltransferase [Bacteroidia bacterium]|nr:WcaF family extracellular polysaccharide biosynthesis acetyltransferase [Bacteroidia bacterium]
MSKTNLSQFNNSWYKPGGNSVKRLLWHFTNVVWFNSGFPISGVKVFILRLYGAKIGSGVVIKPRVNIKYPWKLIVGNNVWIGENVWIDNLGQVTIGDNVCLSQGSFFLCGNHDYKKQTFDLVVGDIILEDGVWIGAKAIVCPGVTCFSHSVLSVGSVATSNLEAYKIYQGNPASVVRERIIQ